MQTHTRDERRRGFCDKEVNGDRSTGPSQCGGLGVRDGWRRREDRALRRPDQTSYLRLTMGTPGSFAIT